MTSLNSIEGGWSFSGYSNDEPFSKALVQGFASTFEQGKMEGLGIYAGNAKNSMIWPGSDSNFIEIGNLALLQSHGSPYNGPNLEFVPQKSIIWDAFQWGDVGKLQWVGLGGCDILAFATYPNGDTAFTAYPLPDRWRGMLQGTSGVLGYRSASYYQVNNTLLGKMSGISFAQELLDGNTFYSAWRSSADFLHRSLGHQAEIAVFTSSEEALSDTLANFTEERRSGLSHKGIRRSIVGSGYPPRYDYCERVDYQNKPICTNFLKEDLYEQIGKRVWLARSECLERMALPVFETKQPKDMEALNKLLRISIPMTHFDSVPYLSAKVPSKAVDDVMEIFIQESTGLLQVSSDSREDGLQSGSRTLYIDGREVSLFGDFGFTLEKAGDTNTLRFRRGMGFGQQIAEERLLSESDTLVDLLLQFTPKGGDIYIDKLRPIYTFGNRESNWVAIPKLAAYMRVVAPWGTNRIVELL